MGELIDFAVLGFGEIEIEAALKKGADVAACFESLSQVFRTEYVTTSREVQKELEAWDRAHRSKVNWLQKRQRSQIEARLKPGPETMWRTYLEAKIREQEFYYTHDLFKSPAQPDACLTEVLGELYQLKRLRSPEAVAAVAAGREIFGTLSRHEKLIRELGYKEPQHEKLILRSEASSRVFSMSRKTLMLAEKLASEIGCSVELAGDLVSTAQELVEALKRLRLVWDIDCLIEVKRHVRMIEITPQKEADWRSKIPFRETDPAVQMRHGLSAKPKALIEAFEAAAGLSRKLADMRSDVRHFNPTFNDPLVTLLLEFLQQENRLSNAEAVRDGRHVLDIMRHDPGLWRRLNIPI